MNKSIAVCAIEYSYHDAMGLVPIGFLLSANAVVVSSPPTLSVSSSTSVSSYSELNEVNESKEERMLVLCIDLVDGDRGSGVVVLC